MLLQDVNLEKGLIFGTSLIHGIFQLCIFVIEIPNQIGQKYFTTDQNKYVKM